MGLSSEMIDQLSFAWDNNMNIKKEKNRAKVTSSTEVKLEDYFTFLDEVVLFFPVVKQNVVLERKVFELD